MRKLIEQLTVLKSKEPDMAKAVENIKKDCQSPIQPNGNIRKPVVELICSCCNKYREDEISHISEVIRNHRSIDKPDLYIPVSHLPDVTVIRVLSLETFIHKHRLASFRDRNPFGKGYDSQSLRKFMKKDLLKKFEKGSIQLDSSVLQGSTSKEGEPSWWTFVESHLKPPESGEIYMKELALSGEELKKAELDNTTVEISIKSSSLQLDMYKPTALDAFSPGSLFEPELTGKPHGYTSPTESGLQARPEIISKSKPYGEFLKVSPISLNKYPYHI